MSDAKHTEGPWHVEPVEGADEWEICTQDGGWIMVLRSTQEATPEERAEDLANAQMMAAAPELLEALRDYRKRFHRAVLAQGSTPDMADAACEKADAAIAKATGSAA